MGWLSGWAKRVKITIDHNDVDAALSNFPVLVYLSASSGRNNDDVTCVFDEIGSNSKKIAVTKSDGTTQCYVEIEKWDSGNEKAWLWVKVPDIAADADTDLYLYYDNTHDDNTDYVGDTNSTPAENVWDSNFKIVLHMTGSSYSNLKDSTSNNNDVDTEGGDPQYQQEGEIAECVRFDGVGDYLKATGLSLPSGQDYTVEIWTTLEDKAVYRIAVEADNDYTLSLGFKETYSKFQVYNHATGGTPTNPHCWAHDPTLDTWYYLVNRCTSESKVELIINGGDITGCEDDFTGQTAASSGLNIGTHRDNNSRYWKGKIDEIRISDTIRCNAWIKASYESQRDDLLDFGSEETSGQTYTKTWQVDALFKKLGVAKPVSVDVLLQKRDLLQSYIINMVLTKALEKPISLDALLKKIGVAKATSVDTLLKKLGIQITKDLNALFKKLGITKTTSVDVLFKKLNVEKTVSINTVFLKTFEKNFGVDANLQKQAILKQLVIDLIILKRLQKQFSTDTILLKKDITKSFSIDAKFCAVVAYTIQKQIDVLLKKLGIAKTFSVDAVLQKTQQIQTQINTLFHKSSTLQKQIDTLFKKLGTTEAFAVDVDLQKTQQIQRQVNALFCKFFAVQRQIDVLFEKLGVTKSFAVDVDFQKAQQLQTQIDTLFRKSFIVQKQIDALFQKTLVTQKQVDALFKQLGFQKTFAVDACIGVVTAQTLSIDVIFRYKVKLSTPLGITLNGQLVIPLKKEVWVES